MSLSAASAATIVLILAVAVRLLWPRAPTLEAPRRGADRLASAPVWRGRLTRAYLRIRRWVDADLREHARPFSFFIAFLPILGTMPFGGPASGGGLTLAWAIAGAAATGWLGFVGWRMARQMRAAALKGDRWYDRAGKHDLPPEYRATESVTRARQRRRQAAKAHPRPPARDSIESS